MNQDHEWKTGDPTIDGEHEQFFVMARRMVTVAKTASKPWVVQEAIEILRDRMALHVQAEETMAAKHDADSLAILVEDHRAIDAELALLIAKSIAGETIAVPEIEAMAQMIITHEREVDVPLFRLIGEKIKG